MSVYVRRAVAGCPLQKAVERHAIFKRASDSPRNRRRVYGADPCSYFCANYRIHRRIIVYCLLYAYNTKSAQITPNTFVKHTRECAVYVFIVCANIWCNRCIATVQ
jgi:hypothetical protein